MKKLILGFVAFAMFAGISSCSKSDCVDCSKLGTTTGMYLCEADYPSAASSLLSWSNYKSLLIASGCTQK